MIFKINHYFCTYTFIECVNMGRKIKVMLVGKEKLIFV